MFENEYPNDGALSYCNIARSHHLAKHGTWVRVTQVFDLVMAGPSRPELAHFSFTLRLQIHKMYSPYHMSRSHTFKFVACSNIFPNSLFAVKFDQHFSFTLLVLLLMDLNRAYKFCRLDLCFLSCGTLEQFYRPREVK